MIGQRLQIAGVPVFHRSPAPRPNWAAGRDAAGSVRHSTLLYGSIALGALAGVAVSAYWWRRHTRALNLLDPSPFDRVEELISSCEKKIEDIERAIEELKEATL